MQFIVAVDYNRVFFSYPDKFAIVVKNAVFVVNLAFDVDILIVFVDMEPGAPS